MATELTLVYNFWNTSPANGSYHRLLRQHNWSPSEINKLDRRGIAQQGENIAAKWAEASAWTILERRKRNRGFELDLVIQRNQSLRIIEVKTRLYPASDPDMIVLEGWLNYKKKCSLVRGTKFVLNSMGARANQLESITCELVAVDILSNQHIAVYRWPDAFSLDQN